MTIDRDAFLKPVPVPMEEVQVPALNGSVWVKGFTAGERTRFEESLRTSDKVSRRKQRQMRERLVVAMACDKDGNKLFTEYDVEKLSAQSYVVLEPVVEVCLRLSGLAGDDAEELTKNSESVDDAA